jgi:hypothetical protein
MENKQSSRPPTSNCGFTQPAFPKKERVVKNGTNSWMMIFPEFSSSTGALTTAQTDNGPDEK